MPDRDWLRYASYLVLAISVVVGLALGVANLNGRQIENAEAYRQAKREAKSAKYQAAEEIAAECSVEGAPVNFVRECLAESVKARSEQYTTSKDLEAQVDMAFWAKWMVYVGVVGIPISILGLIGLLMSLRQTMQAISNDREIGHAQVRAYVSIAYGAPQNVGPERVAFTEISLRNTGQSPAYAVSYVANIFVGPRELPNDRPVIRPRPGDPIPPGITLPSNASLKNSRVGSEKPLTAEQATVVLSDAKDALRLYLACFITYRDVFKERRQTEFCAVLTPDVETERAPDGTFYRGFKWVMTPEHNNAT